MYEEKQGQLRQFSKDFQELENELLGEKQISQSYRESQKNKINSLQKEAQEKNQKIAELEEQIIEDGKEIFQRQQAQEAAERTLLEKNEELEELKQKVEELSEKINDLEQNQEEKEESFDSQNNNLREINQLLIQYGLSD